MMEKEGQSETKRKRRQKRQEKKEQTNEVIVQENAIIKAHNKLCTFCAWDPPNIRCYFVLCFVGFLLD